MPPRKPRPDEIPQRQRFIEAAREVGADESREAFERAFDAIVHCPPEPLGNIARSVRKSARDKKHS